MIIGSVWCICRVLQCKGLFVNLEFLFNTAIYQSVQGWGADESDCCDHYDFLQSIFAKVSLILSKCSKLIMTFIQKTDKMMVLCIEFLVRPEFGPAVACT